MRANPPYLFGAPAQCVQHARLVCIQWTFRFWYIWGDLTWRLESRERAILLLLERWYRNIWRIMAARISQNPVGIKYSFIQILPNTSEFWDEMEQHKCCTYLIWDEKYSKFSSTPIQRENVKFKIQKYKTNSHFLFSTLLLLSYKYMYIKTRSHTYLLNCHVP